MTEQAKKRGGKPKPPENETKEQRFVRVASLRVNKALSAIANIGGVANRANYEYTDEQVQKIFGALDKEVQNLVARFNKPAATNNAGFTL